MAVLFLAACPPVLAASNQSSTNRTMTLTPCPQPPNYLRAVDIEKQAIVESEAEHWPAANRLLDQALAILGTNYDPYHRAIDQTAEYLATTAYMEKSGHIDAAVRNKKFVLDDRLNMQMEPMLCNKVVVRIQ